MKFGVVGVTAAATNFFVLMVLVEKVHIEPLIGNVLAFIVAFQVSFHGHKFWTFADQAANHVKAMAKFFIISLVVNLALNEGLFAMFYKGLHLHYLLAILFTLMIIPPISFVLSKLWAFR